MELPRSNQRRKMAGSLSIVLTERRSVSVMRGCNESEGEHEASVNRGSAFLPCIALPS